MAIVGAGLIAAAGLPLGHASPSTVESRWDGAVSAGSWEQYGISAMAAGAANVTLVWNTSGVAAVSWYAAVPCTVAPNFSSWCFSGSALAKWTGHSGQWTASGAPATGYCIEVVNNGTARVTVSAHFVEQVPGARTHLSPFTMAWSVSGGVILVGLGGTAAYLGVFLPPGVYHRGRVVNDPTADPELMADPEFGLPEDDPPR